MQTLDTSSLCGLDHSDEPAWLLLMKHHLLAVKRGIHHVNANGCAKAPCTKCNFNSCLGRGVMSETVKQQLRRVFQRTDIVLRRVQRVSPRRLPPPPASAWRACGHSTHASSSSSSY